MFNFLPSINNSVTIGLSFLLLCISAIISSKMVNNWLFFFGGGGGGWWIAFFNVFINIIHIIWVFNKSLESLKCFKPVLSQLLIKKWYFPLYGSLAYKCYQYLVADLINWIMNLFFQIQNLQLLILYMDGLYYIATFNLFFFFLLTRSLLITYAYVSIGSIDCTLLSSFELKAILLISPVKTLCLSLLNLYSVFNIDLC